MMLPGVRPSMAWASVPTFRSLPVVLSMATTEGSLRTTPLPFTYTRTEAVPRSIPISFANVILTPRCTFCKHIISGFSTHNHTFSIIRVLFPDCKTLSMNFFPFSNAFFSNLLNELFLISSKRTNSFLDH